MRTPGPFRGGTTRSWIALVPLALAGLALAAPLLAAEWPWAGFSIRQFFSVVCHQDPARSFWIAGAPVAVCVRCLGIYLGAAVGAAVVTRVSRRLLLRGLAVALALNVIDIAAEFAGLHGNLPALRFGSGMAAGVAVGALVRSTLPAALERLKTSAAGPHPL